MGPKQSGKLCLNLWSAKWLRPRSILVSNFNPIVLWISKTWLDSGSISFSIEFLNKKEAELGILTSKLFHSAMTAGKKLFLK